MKKTIFLFSLYILCLSFNSIFAQDKLNNYGYILIPKKLSFQNEPNEYRINKLLKVSFNNYKFNSFIKGDAIPKEIKPCEILNINIQKSGLLTTKLKIDFSDCYGKVIYRSIEGKSRNKDFKLSFYEALRKALKDVNIQNHKFNPTTTNITTLKTKTPKTEINNYFTLSLKNKNYKFIEISSSEYKIYNNKELLGIAKKESNTDTFVIEAKYLSGTGVFDDFGNFIILRTNPLNQQVIKDTMLRIF